FHNWLFFIVGVGRDVGLDLRFSVDRSLRPDRCGRSFFLLLYSVIENDRGRLGGERRLFLFFDVGDVDHVGLVLGIVLVVVTCPLSRAKTVTLARVTQPVARNLERAANRR